MRLTLRRSVLLSFLVTVTIAVSCSGSNPALSQDSEKPAFVSGRVLVKLEAGVPQFSVELVEGLKGANVEEKLSLVDVLVVDLPAGVSVAEAVKLYEGSPKVEYAEPDYLISTAQYCPPPDPDEPETGDSSEISAECIDPALDEPPPDDPPSDVTIQAAGSQTSGTIPVIPNDPYFSQAWGQ
ncbi:MAG: S8 family serine peptidase [Rubrobacteraceae bacterium]